MPIVTNLLFGTTPLMVHANGPIAHNRYWSAIKQAFYASPPPPPEPCPRVTVLTCNNGHPSMGCFEAGLQHLGVPHIVGGRGRSQWVNAVDKPRAIVDALREADSEYVLFGDSRDALLLASPRAVLDGYLAAFAASDVVFGADRVAYPPGRALRRFEEGLPGAALGPFKYLNSGMWFGRRTFALELFRRALEVAPVPEAPTSDQGILRQLLPEVAPRVALDYRCALFQNIGFVADEILQVAA